MIPDVPLNFSTFKFIAEDGVLVKFVITYPVIIPGSSHILSVHFLHNSFAIPVLPYSQ